MNVLDKERHCDLTDEQAEDGPSDWTVISTYSRSQAIADGILIDVSETAREAGFNYPVAVTVGLWDDCVDWTDTDRTRQALQDESGRLWDVIWMAQMAIQRSNADASQLEYVIYRVPRDGRSTKIQPRRLKLIVGPGDQGEPVITLLLAEES